MRTLKPIVYLPLISLTITLVALPMLFFEAAIMPIFFVFCSGIVGGVALRQLIRSEKRLAIAAFVGSWTAIMVGLLFLGNKIEKVAFERSKAIVSAAHQFQQSNGHRSSSIKDLVPKYLEIDAFVLARGLSFQLYFDSRAKEHCVLRYAFAITKKNFCRPDVAETHFDD